MAMTTTDVRSDAERLARDLVERRLAACVQVLGPISSTYRWRGGIETAEEWLCLIKTTAARFDTLAAHIETNHGYETPELTAVPIDHGSTAYLGWVSSATANP
jgi:periplasmic divalent cation tolerance protein